MHFKLVPLEVASWILVGWQLGQMEGDSIKGSVLLVLALLIEAGSGRQKSCSQFHLYFSEILLTFLRFWVA